MNLVVEGATQKAFSGQTEHSTVHSHHTTLPGSRSSTPHVTTHPQQKATAGRDAVRKGVGGELTDTE